MDFFWILLAAFVGGAIYGMVQMVANAAESETDNKRRIDRLERRIDELQARR